MVEKERIALLLSAVKSVQLIVVVWLALPSPFACEVGVSADKWHRRRCQPVTLVILR
jgi:hypothetical protein